jgi:hypothetical protein
MIDPGAAEKLEKLLKLALGTDKEGEAIAAVRAMKRIAGADFHELAARVKGLSEAEMQKIYATGVKDGKDTAAAEANTKFTDIDEPSSHVDMAQFCIDHDRRDGAADSAKEDPLSDGKWIRRCMAAAGNCRRRSGSPRRR